MRIISALDYSGNDCLFPGLRWYPLKDVVRSRWFHAFLLLVWVTIGASLRFTHLAAKPPWTDEFATLVFSLGQSFENVPLNQIISLDTLLLPLHLNPQATASTVVAQLLHEDVHPPLYFVLAHWWMQLFLPQDGLASMWIARSLPALLGVMAIPATFGLSWLAFRSPLVAQLSAAIMAVSPFGIFLAQEARHYTLAIFWVIATLSCLAIAVQHLDRRKPFSWWVGLIWVVVNALGVATHYFFLLTLAAIALVLVSFAFRQGHQDWKALLHPCWQRIYGVAFGTAVGSLVWLPVWQSIRSHETTQWIQSDDRLSLLGLINPIFQALAAWITMLALLPVEADALPIVITAGFVMIVFFLWAIPVLRAGWRMQRSRPISRLAVNALGGFVLGAVALFFLITYGLGSDLTRGARYNFVYFPAVVVLVGASLAAHWRSSAPLPLSIYRPAVGKRISGTSAIAQPETAQARGETLLVPSPWYRLLYPQGQRAVILIWCVGLLSGITVVENLGYQKYYRPDLLLPLIQQTSHGEVLITTTHTTLVQVGEMMGLGWQAQLSQPDANSPNLHFLLAQTAQPVCVENCAATLTLESALAKMSKPLDLWLINFHAPVALERQNCWLDTQPQQPISGYDYRLYHCLPMG